ncbi:hypothetical protein BDP55DRAFT_506245, partial [Colletotrichum godetiae]
LARIWHHVGGSICPPASDFLDFEPLKLHLNSLGQRVEDQDRDENTNDEEDDEEEEKLMACRIDCGDLEKQA